jgi:hypothetical protein
VRGLEKSVPLGDFGLLIELFLALAGPVPIFIVLSVLLLGEVFPALVHKLAACFLVRNQVLEHSVRLLSWFLFGLWSIDLPGHVTAPQGPETLTGGGLPASPEIIIRVVPRSLLQHQKKGPHVDIRFFAC